LYLFMSHCIADPRRIPSPAWAWGMVSLSVRHLVGMAANVRIGKAGPPPFLLLRNPGIHPDVFHPFGVCQHRHIALGNPKDSLAGILVAQGTGFHAFFRGALPDSTKRRTTLTTAATAPGFGFREPIQKGPKLLEAGNSRAPLIPSIFMHGFLKILGTFGSSVFLGTKTTIKAAISNLRKVCHVLDSF
jgi:hypothetical protein